MLPTLLVTIGSIMLIAPAAYAAARRFSVPPVTLLILLGVVLGPMALDVLPEARATWYPALAEVALAMVGFLLGGEFTLANLRERGRAILMVSIAVSAVSAVVVGAGLWALGLPLASALVLGTAATATDPAAVDAVCRDRPPGALPSLLRGVVAVDDVWGMLLFAMMLAALGTLQQGPLGVEALWHAGRELGGSVLLGAVLGAAMAAITGRIAQGEPTRLEALGFVLLSCGAATYLDLSYLLTAVAMGASVANLATHHDVPFREIEQIETPFLVLFFVLAGASADASGASGAWPWVLAYVLLRVTGRWLGGWLGGRWARVSQGPLLGFALLPQAGVALGMTLVAVERVPEVASVLPLVVIRTVIFESLGPIATAWVVDRSSGIA